MENNTFQINIKCVNSAFDDDRNLEIARILRGLVDKLENGYEEVVLYDINGNFVGSGDFIQD